MTQAHWIHAGFWWDKNNDIPFISVSAQDCWGAPRLWADPGVMRCIPRPSSDQWERSICLGKRREWYNKLNFFFSHPVNLFYRCLFFLNWLLTASYQQTTSSCLGFTGRLGLGTQDTHNSPQQVCLPAEFEANRVVCGVDCSIIISSQCSILACGSNR